MSPNEEKFLDAAAQGKLKTVKVLLATGVEVNTQDPRGGPTHRTALMHAAEAGHEAIVDCLISAGAKVDAKDKGWPVDCPGGYTALILATIKGHVGIAHRLLDAGASPKSRGGGTSAMNAAATLGDAVLVKRLLELGADPLMADSSGFTPLASAVQAGNLEVVEILLSLGIPANSSSPGGSPVIQSAVSGGYVDICKMLVKHGADPDMGGEDNFTPLMMACRCVQPELVSYLLSLNVRVNEQDKRGRTALDIIHKMQEPPDFAPDVLKRLVSLGGIVTHPPKPMMKVVRILQGAGAQTSSHLNTLK